MPSYTASIPLTLLVALSACAGPQTSPATGLATSPSAEPAPAAAPPSTTAAAPAGPQLPAISAADGERHRVAAAPAIAALQRGDFEVARDEATALIASEPNNAFGQLVLALARYRGAMEQLNVDVRTVVFAGLGAGGFNHRYMRASLSQTSEALAAVDDSLAVAAAQPAIALELCLACWQVDWNHNRRIDRADRLLFQIETDADGHPLPAGDPRRKPVFRFDRGDVSWARAFVAFQRAALELVLAYDWDAIDELLGALDGKPPKRLVVHLRRPERVARARALILEALHHSAEARARYLDEDDDDREWMPNPHQRSHPLPLPVDAALYDTWAAVVGDLERLVRGQEGLSLSELAALGEHQPAHPLRGYLDVGQLLAHPADIVIPVADLERAIDHGQRLEAALRTLLGKGYRTQMNASPLLGRLARMKGEAERGEESFERKLRYLLWVN